MPEKPKRRKNKNKRKNKQNQPNNSGDKSSCDVSTTEKSQNDNLSPEPGTSECINNDVFSCSTSPNITIPTIDTVQTTVEIHHESNDKEIENTHQETVKEIHLNTENQHLIEFNGDLDEIQNYIVETPEQKKPIPKITNTVKSKSLDNDDDTKIIDVTDDALSEENNVPIIDSSNIIVTDVEADVNWEKIDELKTRHPFTGEIATETISITTLPLNIAQCENIKSLTPDQETSLRNYLKTLNLSTSPDNLNSIEIKTEIEHLINREVKHRLRKKASADDCFSQKLCPPRMLDVIDEEGSSESSMTSRRHSYLSEKKSDFDDLEDEVFEDKNVIKEKFAAKPPIALRNKPLGRLVSQQCVLVDAKLKEPEVSEARGDWTMKTVEKISGAELVYLTDSSSSTSSIHEIEDETDDSIDTDVSVRMITPTIEVIDTENLLKKNFISKEENFNENLNTLNKNANFIVNDKKNNEHVINIEIENNVKKQFITTPNTTPESHEIVILSTDDIETNLYVKELEDEKENLVNNNIHSENKEEKPVTISAIKNDKCKDKFDLEIKVIKCELNDAFNNLIKEVASDSESSNDLQDCRETFTRQDSSSSVCSSQSTAKYNPTSTSLNDISNINHDEALEGNLNENNSQSIKLSTKESITSSHVNDVIEHVPEANSIRSTREDSHLQHPSTLKEISVKKIASLPYGEKILEELASVSEQLQNIGITQPSHSKNYVSEQVKKYESDTENIISTNKPVISVPPPIKPRVSSLRKSQDNECNFEAPRSEPKLLSMSPSQKMLMEKTNTHSILDHTKEKMEQHTDHYHRKISSGENKKESQDIFQSTDLKPDVKTFGPLKSQTGSRLLALICDPKITSTVNSLKNRCDNNINSTENNLSYRKISRESNDHYESCLSRDYSHTFKPIPPPRPRKISLGFYDSEDNSDFAENSLRSMKSEKKSFHFSTGNLNKEIESDISSIQNMHRFYTNTRDQIINYNKPRRPSLPKDLCEQQMEYIRQKEKEVEAEIERLEKQSRLNSANHVRRGPRAPLILDKDSVEENRNNFFVSHKRDIPISSKDTGNSNTSKLSSLFSSSQEELQREKMYTEYVTQMAERMERKHHKVIKIRNTPVSGKSVSKSMPILDVLDSKVNNKIEKEFISKARERWDKLGIRDPETDDERSRSSANIYREPTIIEHKIKVIESGEEKDVQKLPSHLQDFIRFTVKDKGDETNNSGESENDPASPYVVIWCAVLIIIISIGKYFVRLLRNSD